MAAAVHLPDPPTPRNDVSMGPVHAHAHSHSSTYPQRPSITDFDLRDDRYPSLATRTSPTSPSFPPSQSAGVVDPALDAGMTAAHRASYEKTFAPGATPPQKAWLGENITQEPVDDWNPSHATPPGALLEAQFRSPVEDALSSGIPHDNSLPLEDAVTSGPLDSAVADAALAAMVPLPMSPEPVLRPSSVNVPGDRTDSSFPPTPRIADMSSPLTATTVPPVIPGTPSAPRHPSLPQVGIGAASGSTGMPPPIVPLSAGPSYNPSNMQIPISSNPRAYAQHPTYITPATAPAMQPSFSPPQVPKEEVCVECAMRDQDMADVDVTSPGIWERESDILYEELCRRDAEEEATGQASSDTHSRPRARGGRLTEENLKFWLSINPKEPSSRQQTLDMYVKAQRSLLEADALARARAQRESRLLDEKMRDTFTQLRRSAYELGSSSQPTDDSGALRIKSPRVPSQATSGAVAGGHSREVTLLENGMIVEHVDLRREEREERERKRREERRERSRARKTSRSSRSAIDVASVYSAPLASPLPPMDSGFFSNALDSRYSSQQSAGASPRPGSVMTGGERLNRAQSQASFSDMMSLGSASPRRSRFFGFRNLSSAWQSRDSMAPSGSMIDMHLALQQEQQYFAAHPSAVDISGSNAPTLRVSQSWPRTAVSPEPTSASTAPSTTKKKNGLKKIWKLVTGTSKGASKGTSQSRSVDRHEDDLPLAPPPPLSYLVEREGGGSRRHVSTPSLLSSVSPNQFSQWAPSPPTAPSSALPSPTSSRYPVHDREMSGDIPKEQVMQEMVADNRISTFDLGSSHDNNADSDPRGRTTQSSSRTLSSLGPATPGASPYNRPQSMVMMRRDKSLPPLPGEPAVEFPSHPMPDIRPQTMYDLLQSPSSPMARGPNIGLTPPRAPFRTMETRRQSFGGTASIPHPAVQSLPGRRGGADVPPFLAEEKYAEFGASTPSLTQWGATGTYAGGATRRPANTLTTPAKPKQRRSRFGLSSLFGKKSGEMARDSQVFAASSSASAEPLDYNPYRSSASDQRGGGGGDESSWIGPGSTHTGSSVPPRASTASRNLVELVEQDPEFVAYRYPSSGQRLEVLR